MPDVMGANPLEPSPALCPDCGRDVLQVFVGRGQPVLVERPELLDPGPGLYVAVAYDGRARPVRLPTAELNGEAIHHPHEPRCP